MSALLLSASMNYVAVLKDTFGFWYQIIFNAIGVLAMLFSVISYQFKRRFAIMSFMLTGQVCWVLYFVWQGDLVSALTCFITVSMLVVFLFRDRAAWAKSRVWLFVFLGAIVLSSVLTFRDWRDVFPMFAGVFIVLSNYMLDEKKLRIFAFFSLFCWVSNGILKGYYVALISDLSSLISNIVSLYRYRNVKKKGNEDVKTE